MIHQVLEDLKCCHNDGPRLKALVIPKVITIYPEEGLNVCSKFHDNQKLLRHFTQKHVCQPHGGAKVKVRGTPKACNSSSGDINMELH